MEHFFDQLAATPPVEWVGMVAGIVGVWLSIKEKILAWPLFITCYGCYVYISYAFGLPALMGMNIVFIGLSVYGWVKWSRQVGRGEPLHVSRTARHHWPLIGAFIALGTFGLGWVIANYGGANWPYVDALATCCGFTAQWMLGRKQIETWLFWIISDIIYLTLFAMGASWPSVILFGTFIVLAVKGWIDWRKLDRTQRYE